MEKNQQTNNVNIVSNDDKLKDLILQKGKLYSLNDFDVIRQLGNGAYAKVYLAKNKNDEKEYALKTISKASLLKEQKLYQLYLETQLMLELDNHFIAKLHGAFEESGKLILVMDIYKNGDLFDFISINSKNFNNKLIYFAIFFFIFIENLHMNVVKHISAQIVLALKYLREKRVCHRDLKPENIMLDENFDIKFVSK